MSFYPLASMQRDQTRGSSAFAEDDEPCKMGGGYQRGTILAARLQILGWILFIVSALAFMASSIRNGDTLGLVGGAFFLLACFVFLIPYALPANKR